MKPKTEVQLAQKWEELINDLAQMDVEPADAERIIAHMEETHPDASQKTKDDVREAVAEAFKRRNAPKQPVPPGSGKSSL